MESRRFGHGSLNNLQLNQKLIAVTAHSLCPATWLASAETMGLLARE